MVLILLQEACSAAERKEEYCGSDRDGERHSTAGWREAGGEGEQNNSWSMCVYVCVSMEGDAWRLC